MPTTRVWPPAHALSPAALLAALLGVNTAHADPFTSYGAGLFVGMDLASGGVVWGAEGLASYEPAWESCSNDPRTVYGPIARFNLHGVSQPELHFAGFAGKELDRGGPGPLAELGVTLAFPDGIDEDAQWSPHTGVGLEASILNLFLRQEWLIRSFSVGLGVRVLPAFGEPGSCVIGRPQRDGLGGRARVRFVHRTGLCGCRVNDAKAAALAREFRTFAQQEYESVPAFFQLANELAALDAPASLRHRSFMAAQDELVHTRLCAELARRFGDGGFVPAAPRISRRPALTGKLGLQRLALESWIDGCLGEGLAATLAGDLAERSQDERVRHVQAQIAVDEQRHAELGWDVLRWCIEQEPSARGLVRAHSALALRLPPSALVSAKHRGVLAAGQRRLAMQRLAAC